MKVIAKTVDELKKDMVCHLTNEISLVMKYTLTGTYIIDSLEKDDTLFVRNINGPLGLRYMLKKELVFNHLDKNHLEQN